MYTDRPISLQSSKFLSRLIMNETLRILKNEMTRKTSIQIGDFSQYIKEKGTCEFNEKVYELDQNINLPGLFVSRALWGGDQHALLLQCVCLYLCLSLTQSGQHAKNSTRCKQPTRCNNFRLLIFLLIYLNLFHTLRATNSPIFRSTFLTVHTALVQCTDIAADR